MSNPAVDAVQLIRCVDTINAAGRDAILADYIPTDGCDACADDIRNLLTHMALFVAELIHHNTDLDSRWLGRQMSNLVAGPHEDAHRLVIDGAFYGDWAQFWDFVDSYTTRRGDTATHADLSPRPPRRQRAADSPRGLREVAGRLLRPELSAGARRLMQH